MPTGPCNIQTPTGPAVGSIFARMEILGIASMLTQTGNQPNDEQQWQEIIDISVPVGTHAVVVSQDYWLLAFGSLTSNLDPLDPNQNPGWNTEDHNMGLGRASVAVVDVNAPDFTVAPPKQTARILVRMNLRDENGDDSWIGLVGYTLTFLGFAQKSPILGAISTLEREQKIIFHGGKSGSRSQSSTASRSTEIAGA
jgi:hypothetical protein